MVLKNGNMYFGGIYGLNIINPKQLKVNENKSELVITKFEIPRLDYHVGNGKFLKMGVVGEFVSVEIAVEALTKKK